MKSRISFSHGLAAGAIAALGMVCYDQYQLHHTRLELADVRAKAAAMGISTKAEDVGNSGFAAKRDREAAETANREAVSDFLELLDQIIGLSEEDKSKEDELGSQLMVQWMALNPKALELLVAEMLQALPADGNRQQMAAISLVKLAAELPESALAYLDQASAHLKGHPERVQFLEITVSEALKSWAKRNPLAAAQWVQENGEKYDALLSSQAKHQLLTSAASVDLDLAFRLVERLELNSSDSAVMLARSAATPQQRTDFLQALEQNSSSIADESLRSEMKRKAMEVIATRTLQDGFVEATSWVESIHLDSDEIGIFVSKLDYAPSLGETGEWLDWLGDHSEIDQAANTARQLVIDWTNADYQAAGDWLRTAEEGEIKFQAIQAYAVTISKYDVESARQWALTLPAGDLRDATLREIE